MVISLKCQYAIRGVLELARHYGQAAAVPVSAIGRTYGISTRFLVVILNELKRGGFVRSKRGVQGGFLLAVPPKELHVGDIIRFVDGPMDPVRCVVGRDARVCPRWARCSLKGLWAQAREAMEQVCDSATFEDLVRQEHGVPTPDYCI